MCKPEIDIHNGRRSGQESSRILKGRTCVPPPTDVSQKYLFTEEGVTDETLGSVTELRRSRRLQGREPILQPLPQRIEMEDDHRPTVNGSYLPCQRQRDPFTFSGDEI
ncbi:hypothetical protein LAZ67_13002137 [Cordylochernes scorpioides]|uniref:Uncharacterized protein n=1 Tax=Cordylochernes scorpioides TaxID=51811 RepID=A0ABY6L4E2_9ARAC|nr:hypothetical protein LAZ67_13002137 [Cordylochernes scorpioides]